jgi:tRNA-specific 2-thiouridylase
VVAAHLGIPHHLANFEDDFSRLIISDFIARYQNGQTPNPCVCCNRYIKFGLLLDKALKLGAEFLATGHYVRKTVDPDATCHLRVARNSRKDQSYFLYTLTQKQLQQIIFPLGDVENKDEVRRLATEFGLPVAQKSDSQEGCFIPNDDYVAFLEREGGIVPQPGEIVHLNGTVVGRHMGTHRYTIGQRKGMGIAWSEPLHVLDIDKTINRLVVGEQQHLLKSGLTAEEVSWLTQPPAEEFETTCKIRYRHQPVPCRVTIGSDNRCRVRFVEPQRSVTPGQALVFYQGDEVLGGGRIIGAEEE